MKKGWLLLFYFSTKKNKETINEAVASGANMFVAGSAIFGKNDRKKAIEDIRNSIK